MARAGSVTYRDKRKVAKGGVRELMNFNRSPKRIKKERR
jgi:hypothetical protein